MQNKKNALHPPAWGVPKTSPRRTVFRLFVATALVSAFASLGQGQGADAAPAPKSPFAPADSLLNEDKPEAALAHLSEVAAKDPKAPGLEGMLGKAYFQSKRFPR